MSARDPQHPTPSATEEHATTGASTDLRVMLDAQRERCPVAHHDDGTVTLLGHAEVRAAALDDATFSSAATNRRAIPNSLDGEEHGAYRALIDAYLTQDEVDAQEPQAQRHASAIIASLPRGTMVRTITDIGTPFAVRVQRTWLGWPESIDQPLVDWMARNRDASRSGDRAQLARVAEEFDELIMGLLDERRHAETADAAATDDATATDEATATADVTSRLMREKVGGQPLTDAEVVSILRNWTAGDLGSLAASIGVIVHHLATDVALQSYLRTLVENGDTASFDDAMEEILRIDDPFISNRRVTTRPVTLGERDVPAGTRVVLNWVAANRDPAAFPDPDAFNPAANKDSNLVFGIGPHVCPGRALTLMELRVVVWELLAHTSAITMAPTEAPVREKPPVSGWAQVPIVLHR